ncbi:hypothetical protein D9M69_677680 [compost metagenome]
MPEASEHLQIAGVAVRYAELLQMLPAHQQVRHHLGVVGNHLAAAQRCTHIVVGDADFIADLAWPGEVGGDYVARVSARGVRTCSLFDSLKNLLPRLCGQPSAVPL